MASWNLMLKGATGEGCGVGAIETETGFWRDLS